MRRLGKKRRVCKTEESVGQSIGREREGPEVRPLLKIRVAVSDGKGWPRWGMGNPRALNA